MVTVKRAGQTFAGCPALLSWRALSGMIRMFFQQKRLTIPRFLREAESV